MARRSCAPGAGDEQRMRYITFRTYSKQGRGALDVDRDSRAGNIFDKSDARTTDDELREMQTRMRSLETTLEKLSEQLLAKPTEAATAARQAAAEPATPLGPRKAAAPPTGAGAALVPTMKPGAAAASTPSHAKARAAAAASAPAWPFISHADYSPPAPFVSYSEGAYAAAGPPGQRSTEGGGSAQGPPALTASGGSRIMSDFV